MHSHIQKWGNSLGVRIPIQLAKRLNLHPGSPVTIDIEDGRIVVQTPQYNLETMLEQITPLNRHHLQLDDTREGKEEW
ncbi:MAG: AbrB/MazE/SpoVT family DNA-binding domain-containing protein [Parachlamydia sp.]|nr:AbrB/MazE/SpoVT family DNA-binding domain-containing protein [Parachlamydia sp.]